MVLVKLSAQPTPGTVVVARDPDHRYVVKEVGRVTSRAIELLSLNLVYAPLCVPHAAGTVLGMMIRAGDYPAINDRRITFRAPIAE